MKIDRYNPSDPDTGMYEYEYGEWVSIKDVICALQGINEDISGLIEALEHQLPPTDFTCAHCGCHVVVDGYSNKWCLRCGLDVEDNYG